MPGSMGISIAFDKRVLIGPLRRATYVTEGIKAGVAGTGYEGPIVQICGGPVILLAIYIYLSNTIAVAQRSIQIFDGVTQATSNVPSTTAVTGDVPNTTQAQVPWNPRFMTMLNPGQLLTWEPTSEFNTQSHWLGEEKNCPGWVEASTDGDILAHPFENGIIVGCSTVDTRFTSGEAAMRITARIAYPDNGHDPLMGKP